jgi:hypothetical protein
MPLVALSPQDQGSSLVALGDPIPNKKSKAKAIIPYTEQNKILTEISGCEGSSFAGSCWQHNEAGALCRFLLYPFYKEPTTSSGRQANSCFPVTGDQHL